MFKVGDKVKITKPCACSYENPCLKIGETGTIINHDGDNEGSYPLRVKGQNDYCYYNADDLVFMNGRGCSLKDKPMKFLLKYDLDEDTIEEFATIQEVNKRIKELLDNSSLKRDSMVVYEIKSKKSVKIEPRIVIK